MSSFRSWATRIAKQIDEESGWVPPDPASFAAAPRFSSFEEVEEDGPYWTHQGWVPTMKSGKQRTPNQIRNELQKYIDNSSETQTAIVQRMGVSNNSFRKFMNPGTYKNQWSATANGTYWAAARLLEEERQKPKKRKAAPTKTDDYSAEPSKKKSKEEDRLDAVNLLMSVHQFETRAVSSDLVFDSCQELVKKAKAFLQTTEGLTKTHFCTALGIQAAQLNKFLASKKQDAAGTLAYRAVWVFFEKLRIMQNKPKSKKRLENEIEHPTGFELKKESTRGRYFLVPASYYR